MSGFDLDKFRNDFLKSDGWQVSDCYKTYDDKFLRKDAQDAYEGAKWAWNEQQKKIVELQEAIKDVLDYIGDDFDDYYTGVMIKSIHEDFKLKELLKCGKT